MTESSKLQEWLDSPYVDELTKKEILSMTDKSEISEAFSADLRFGTAGMRGVMGPGNNRMNLYTIRRASLGVARWVGSLSPEAKLKGAAIAYDTRHNSWEFAKRAALTLAQEGVKVYLFDSPTPTPMLSYAIRRLECVTGIVITASHNTKEFNGMKIYNDGGCQLSPAEVVPLMDIIKLTPLFSAVPDINPDMAFEAFKAEERIIMIGAALKKEFIDVVLERSLLEDRQSKGALSIAYTPLHGTGNAYVREVLARAGFTRVEVVEEQEKPDGDFPTVRQPNPEITDALSMAIDLGARSGARLVVGTDPDSDRMGAAVYHEGAFINITGNQIGVLLTDFILSRKKEAGTLPKKGVFIDTIVTSSLGEVIARSYGLKIIKTLTGFKYIGEKMIQIEKESRADARETFVFGYEEANGYLIGDYARDKDAIGAVLIFCEAAAYWLGRGKTLIDRLREIYKIYGYFLDHLDDYDFPGIAGMAKIAGFMEALRKRGLSAIPRVSRLEDYMEGINGMPKDNVLRFMLDGDSWIAARPSGTEPKLKIYYSIRGDDESAARHRLSLARSAISSIIS